MKDVKPTMTLEEARALPAEMGCPAPTMPLAPRMPRSRSAICIEPPLPLQ